MKEAGVTKKALLGLALCCMVVALWWWYWRADVIARDFEYVSVKKGDITALVTATGTVESIVTVTVGSQVSAPVKKVLVDFNSVVREGDVLAILDPSEFRAKVAQKEAALESTKADLMRSKAALASAQSALDQAKVKIELARSQLEQLRSQQAAAESLVRDREAGVEKAEAELENARVQFMRFKRLYKRDLIARSDLEQNDTAFKVALSKYKAAVAALESARSQYREAVAKAKAGESSLKEAEVQYKSAQADCKAALAQIASVQARVKQARADLEQARVDVERTIIRSPISGVVISKKIEPGQTVAAAFQAPELFKIAKDLHHMQVKAEVSEADVGNIEEGQDVTFRVDAYPDKTFKGKVIQVRMAPEETGSNNAAGNVVVYGVVVSAPNPQLLLKPGMTATVEIKTRTVKDVLLVPNKALRFIPPAPYVAQESDNLKKQTGSGEQLKESPGRPGTVWVKGKEGPERRDLWTGITDGEFTQIVSGPLKEGELVITGLRAVKEKKRRRMRLVL